MNALMEATKRRSAAQDALAGHARFATVASYNADNGTAKVLYQPENVLSGWLPVLSQSVGPGWGLHVPLSPGDQVLIIPQEGDTDNGVIIGRAFSEKARPPSSAGADIAIRSSAGGKVTLQSNGGCIIQDPHGATVELPGDGTVLLRDQAVTSMTFSNNGSIAVQGVFAVTGSIKINGVVVVAP